MKWLFGFITMLSMQAMAQQPDDVYLFSYFKNNGEDGLHLAYSYDGLKWTALKNDSSFLKPAVATTSTLHLYSTYSKPLIIHRGF